MPLLALLGLLADGPVLGGPSELAGHTKTITCLAWSHDGRSLASGSKDGTVRVWDVAKRKARLVLEGHKDMATAVAFSPDGKLLASASHDRHVTLWDTATGKVVAELKGHRNEVHGLCFSRDGKLLASASADYTVRLWDVGARKEKARLTGADDALNDVSVAPDGRSVAAACWDGGVHRWELPSGKYLGALKGHTEMVRRAVHPPDGKWIASSGKDGTVRVWAAAGKAARVLRGHRDLVRALSFAPDGLLASGSRDETLRLWDVTTGREVFSEKVEGRPVQVLAFSPKGDLLALGSLDSKVRLLRVEAPKALGPVEARKQVGKSVTVEMTVKAAKDRLQKRKEIYLDSEEDFKDEKNFAVVIDLKGAASLKKAGIADPARHFKGKKVRATGTVTVVDKVPRIVIQDATGIKVVKDAK